MSLGLIILINSVLMVQSTFINIASGKTAILCNKSFAALTDGDRTTKVRSMRGCNGSNFEELTVIFDKEYVVLYLKIFTGETGKYKKPQHPLDMIEIYGGGRTCSIRYEKVNLLRRLDNGIRINCIKPFYPDPNITIKFNFTILSEIEVYTYDTPKIYRGCVNDSAFEVKLFGRITFNRSDINYCLTECGKTYKTFVAIHKVKNKCICHDVYYTEDLIPYSKCNKICDGTQDTCGGRNAYSIYLSTVLLPAKVGCATGLRRIKFNDIYHFTFIECMEQCDNYVYSLLKGNSCLCQEDFDNFDLLPRCDYSCTINDRDEICREPLPVVYKYNMSCKISTARCSQVMQCKAGTFDEFGVCTRGCRSNFIGEHCLEVPKPGAETTTTTPSHSLSTDDTSEETIEETIEATTPNHSFSTYSYTDYTDDTSIDDNTENNTIEDITDDTTIEEPNVTTTPILVTPSHSQRQSAKYISLFLFFSFTYEH